MRTSLIIAFLPGSDQPMLLAGGAPDKVNKDFKEGVSCALSQGSPFAQLQLWSSSGGLLKKKRFETTITDEDAKDIKGALTMDPEWRADRDQLKRVTLELKEARDHSNVIATDLANARASLEKADTRIQELEASIMQSATEIAQLKAKLATSICPSAAAEKPVGETAIADLPTGTRDEPAPAEQTGAEEAEDQSGSDEPSLVAPPSDQPPQRRQRR